MIKVKLVYRNYKSLHSMFATYAECPPKGVVIDVPAPKSQTRLLSKLFIIQRKFSDCFFTKWVLSKVVDPFFFGSSMLGKGNSDTNLFHFLNMIPSRQPSKPYIVEFENVGMLFGYGNKDQQEKAKSALINSLCKAIICSSKAARKTLKEFLEDDYHLVSKKVYVIYPAIYSKYVMPIREKDNGKIKVLFVGNLCYLKGLEEVFLALETEPAIMGKIKMDIISDDARCLIDRYPNLAGIVNYHMPRFSKKEILEKFYANADVLLMPTKRDTFGFAIVDALAAGIPVISTKQFAIPELIDDGQDGILLNLGKSTLGQSIYLSKEKIEADMVSNPDPKLVAGLKTVFKNLVAGRYDMKKMGQVGMIKVRPGGQFSVSRRNKLLTEVYAKVVSE